MNSINPFQRFTEYSLYISSDIYCVAIFKSTYDFDHWPKEVFDCDFNSDNSCDRTPLSF